MKQSLRLITLDATGTIFKFKQPPPVVYAKIGQKHGLECDKVQIQASFKKAYKACLKEHPHFGSTTGISSKKWWIQGI